MENAVNDKSQKNYIMVDFGNEMDDIFANFENSISHVDYIVSDSRDRCAAKKTIKSEELRQLADNPANYVLLGNVKNYESAKDEIAKKFNFDSSRILPVHDFILDMIDKDDVFLKPAGVRIDASTVCNLNCLTCYMRKFNNGTMGNGFLSASNFSDFVNKNGFIKHVEFANNGEALLNPEFNKLIDICQDHNITFSLGSGVNTNRLSKKTAEKIVKSGLMTHMTISIDGATQGTYEVYRRKGNFSKVIENIKKINYFKHIYKTDLPRLKWQFILFEHNQDEVEYAINMANALDMKIYFKLDWGAGFVPRDPQKLEKLTGLRAFTRKSYNSSNASSKTNSIYLANSVCQGLYKNPQINWDGRLLGCCCVFTSDWGMNVFESDYVSALNSHTYKNALKTLFGKYSLPKETPCALCRYSKEYRQGKKINI